MVTEAPAICLYLADRYGYGDARAPKIDEPDRGPYLKWMVWSTAVLEPARELQLTTVRPPKSAWGVGWPAWDVVVEGAGRRGRAIASGCSASGSAPPT